MKYVLWFLRITVGVLFIFSGLVKANDPLGLSYKMNEFFDVLHMSFFSPYSEGFSVVMISLEVVTGIALIMGYAFRAFSLLLLLLSIFYTFLTGYALFSGKITECGCFGNCIKISNEATFYKDVALLIASVILFAYRGRIKPLFHRYTGTAIFVICLFLSFGIQWWVLEHLPFYDCLAYKAGNNLWQKMQMPPNAIPDQYKTVMIYEKDGVKKEFTTENYPWQDSTWKFVDSKSILVKKGNADPEIKDFVITDSNKNDHTQEILTAKGYVFLWFIRDVSSARTDNMYRIHSLINEAKQMNIPFYALCSSNWAAIRNFQQKWDLGQINFYELDGTVNKTAMRTNPGLMVLDNGVVQHKWSFRDYPANISLVNGKLEYH